MRSPQVLLSAWSPPSPSPLSGTCGVPTLRRQRCSPGFATGSSSAWNDLRLKGPEILGDVGARSSSPRQGLSSVRVEGATHRLGRVAMLRFRTLTALTAGVIGAGLV